jgi:excisionase family DNA binding protein
VRFTRVMRVTTQGRWLSLAEAAIRIGLHPTSVRRAIARGELPAVRFGTGRLARIGIEESVVEGLVRSASGPRSGS